MCFRANLPHCASLSWGSNLISKTQVYKNAKISQKKNMKNDNIFFLVFPFTIINNHICLSLV